MRIKGGGIKISDELKPSSYNIIIKDIKNRYILANTLSGGLISLDNFGIDQVTKIFENDIINIEIYDSNIISLLKDNGFIIPYVINEIDLLKERHWKARNGRNALGLAIGVTQGCNFACTYCYQHHHPICLSADIQQNIIAYIKNEIPSREILRVVWWGGEPLLRIDIIKNLTAKLRKICTEYNCQYSAAISTNGYLLSKTIANDLVQMGINDVQITLDGPPEIHDTRRYLKNGTKTFDRIYKNICASANLFERLVIRVNVDKRNVNSIKNLLNLLDPLKQWIVLAFRATTSSDTPNELADWCLPATDYWIFEDGLVEFASKKGFKFSFGFPVPGTSFCAGYQRNAIIVDSYGDVHRCPVCVGRRNDRIGFLEKDGTISNLGGPQHEWDKWSPFDDPECLDCISLPICMGGCLWYIESPKKESIRCFAKHNIVERMKYDATLSDWVHLYDTNEKEVNKNP